METRKNWEGKERGEGGREREAGSGHRRLLRPPGIRGPLQVRLEREIEREGVRERREGKVAGRLPGSGKSLVKVAGSR